MLICIKLNFDRAAHNIRIFENKKCLKTRGIHLFNDINQNVITIIENYYKILIIHVYASHMEHF